MVVLFYLIISLSMTLAIFGMSNDHFKKINMPDAPTILESHTQQDKQAALEKIATTLNALLRLRQINGSQILENKSQERFFLYYTIPLTIPNDLFRTKLQFSNSDKELIAWRDYFIPYLCVLSIDNKMKKNDSSNPLANNPTMFLPIPDEDSFRIINLTTGQSIGTKKSPVKGPIRGFISNNSQLLLTVLGYPKTRSFKIVLNELNRIDKTSWEFNTADTNYPMICSPIIFSKDDTNFAYLSTKSKEHDVVINLHDTKTGKQCWHKIVAKSKDGLLRLGFDFTPDGKNLAALIYDHTKKQSKLLIIDCLDPKKTKKILSKFEIQVQALKVARNNKLLLVVDNTGIKILDINNGSLVKQFDTPEGSQEVDQEAFAQNSIGTDIATLDNKNNLSVRKIIEVLLPYDFAEKWWNATDKKPTPHFADIKFA